MWDAEIPGQLPFHLPYWHFFSSNFKHGEGSFGNSETSQKPELRAVQSCGQEKHTQKMEPRLETRRCPLLQYGVLKMLPRVPQNWYRRETADCFLCGTI